MNDNSQPERRRRPGPRAQRRRARPATAVAVLAAAAALTACGGRAPNAGGAAGATAGTLSLAALPDTTPGASGEIGTLNWDLFYEPTSVDPAHALDYTENEVVANMCDTLVRMTPGFTYEPGLATYSSPNPTTWVYKIRPGAKFWDGTPVTAADVAYSLERNLNPKVGSYWSDYFQNIQSISATGPREVTVKLTRPDEVFNQGMALAAGAITEQRFDEEHGSSVGTPSVGVMCSGPYKFVSWTPGNDIVLARNKDYWDPRIHAKANKIVFSFIGTDSAETNALLGGSIQGMYETPISGSASLRSSSGKLYLGKSLTQYVMECFMHSSRPSDPINNRYVRQALSLAINRESVANVIFDGVAAPPVSRALFADAGTYSYGQSVFEPAAKALPSLSQDVAEAKRLVAKAGNPTTPIVVSYASDGPSYNIQFAEYLQSAAQAVGLKVQLNPMTTAEFNNLGFDQKLDETTDLALSIWFNELPDPVQWYRLFTPSASGALSVFNYGQYQDAAVTSSIRAASETTDPGKRAQYVVRAQQQIMTDLPWIPVVDLPNRLYMAKGISGPPASEVQSWYPWATSVGATG
jgi:peptide/nickel transport system substrate-binding protein